MAPSLQSLAPAAAIELIERRSSAQDALERVPAYARQAARAACESTSQPDSPCDASPRAIAAVLANLPWHILQSPQQQALVNDILSEAHGALALVDFFNSMHPISLFVSAGADEGSETYLRRVQAITRTARICDLSLDAAVIPRYDMAVRKRISAQLGIPANRIHVIDREEARVQPDAHQAAMA